MSRGITVSAEPDIIGIEDEIADFTADLLSLAANEPILERLFTQSAGTWTNLTDFLEADDLTAQEVASLQSACKGLLRVTWLEHPELESGYCLVLFYVDSLGWNSLASYNKARLQKSNQSG
ncbi:MAG: hypothetical protein AAGL17_13410 [Cyanobacteria bacterium J06576_12]